MITITATRSDLAVYAEQVIQQEHDQPLRSCLGPGCCPQCGWSRSECHCAEYAAEDAATNSDD